MRAMLLAAGLGTRLAPLTQKRPKCLMPVMNRPLLGLWMGRLAKEGVTHAVVNTHHLAVKVRAWIKKYPTVKPALSESYEPEILGTGGALIAAREQLGEDPFLLVNADVACTSPLKKLHEAHLASEGVMLLGLVDDPRFNTVAVDETGKVLGFKGDDGIPDSAGWLTYSGLASISPGFLSHLPQSGFSSLVEGMRTAIKKGETVRGMPLSGYWNDLGTPEGYLSLHLKLAYDPPPELTYLKPYRPVEVANGAHIEPGAEARGMVVMGTGAVMEPGSFVEDSVLLPGARVRSGVTVKKAVLGDEFMAREDIFGGAHA